MKVYHWMGSWLSWRMGDSKLIHLGVDPFVGGNDIYCLSQTLCN